MKYYFVAVCNEETEEFHDEFRCFKKETAIDIFNKLIKKYNGKCAYCGQICIEKYHIDHKIPLVKGGGNEFENLALSCPRCNLSKNDKTDVEYIGYEV